MMIPKHFLSSAIVLGTLISGCLSQAPEGKKYTHPPSNITFDTWSIPASKEAGGWTFGMVLPSTATKTDATDFIGYLKCATTKEASNGWCGISLGGAMTDSLLFLAWADGHDVRTSLRFTSKYSMPKVYTGNATVTQITSHVNATAFSLTFLCKDCLHWSQNDTTGKASTSSGLLDLGYAQSEKRPGNPHCPPKTTFSIHDSHGTWVAMVDKSTTSKSYRQWSRLANHTLPDACAGSGSRNRTATHHRHPRNRVRYVG